MRDIAASSIPSAPKPRVLGVVGATASGKTAVALEITRLLPCEIICMDSMQIYRGMDIGTAKPTPAEQAAAPHHMLDIISPTTPYSVADYVPAARAVIADIHARGRVPLLVGGTGMYLRGLTLPQDYGGLPGDPALRAQLHAELDSIGALALHARLRLVDAPTAARLHPNDTRRVIRALEIYRLTGVPMSQHQAPTEADSPYDFALYAVDWPRDILHARINRRVDAMLDQGLLHEVTGLLQSGVPPQAQSMQGLGYKELAPVVLAGAPLAKAAEDIKTGTRNYARRQLTWFRGDRRVRWIASDQAAAAAQAIAQAWKEQETSWIVRN